MPRRLVLLALPLVVSLAGCGSAVVDAKDVAAAVADSVQPRLGSRPDVTCPHDVDAEVGARTRCTLTGAGLDGSYGVTVTVASVADDHARFDVEVDTEPSG